MSIMETMTKQQALANFLEVEVTDFEINNSEYILPNGDSYFVLTDDEADEYATDEIENMLWAFNAAFLASYTGLHEAVFEALAEGYENSNEAIMALINNAGSMDEFVQESIDADGRGHFVANYDGEEIELEDDYYAYRVN